MAQPKGVAWRLLVTGGGTGGHIYPALAIARRAHERFGPVEVFYVGSKGGLEERLVPAAGFAFTALPVRGLVRKRPREVVQGLAQLGAAFRQAVGVVRRFRPDVVVGTGGYAAAPIGAAAIVARRPLILQEQNVIPGVTNRLLAPFASAVAVPYAEAQAYFPTRANLWAVGNPVRQEVIGVQRSVARARLGLTPDAPFVLFYGGSRGSAVFVRLFAELVRVWPPKTQLWFVSGEAHHAAAAAAGTLPPNVTLVPYLNTMGDALAAADLVVARAGGMALAEVAVCGRPAVLIPSPHVTHHHQDANAAVFARAGAAVVLAEEGLDGARLGAVVTELLEAPDRLAAMAAAARGLGRPEALDDLVARIADTARHRISRKR